MPETIPSIGRLTVPNDPGDGTFDFDRKKSGINDYSDTDTKSVPGDFLKVTLQLEKAMKFLFFFIAII